MSPRGRILDKEKIMELSGEQEITILCGHYEGIDQRILTTGIWKRFPLEIIF